MFKRITLITNYNLYESKRHFTKKLAEAMQRKGIETQIFDVKERPLEADVAAEIKSFKPDFTCSFNSLLPLPNQKYLWDVINIPHISFLVDPALYSVALTHSPLSILSCVDRDDCTALNLFNFQNTFFWPHAVERDIKEEHGERPYDVVLIGSCYDYENLRSYWQMQNFPEINKALDDAISIVLSDKPISLPQALVNAWNAAGLSPENVDFMALFYYLDNYTRGKDRVELVRSIRNAKVHIFGDKMTDHPGHQYGWEHYVGKQSNVVIHPSVPYEESFNILKKSKICLNSMPFFRNGSHERVFNALACGSVPMTSDTLYWQEQFTEGKEILTYHPGNWGTVNERIDNLLKDEKQRAKIAASGRAKVMQEHTWDKRVEQLIKDAAPFLKKVMSDE